MEDKSSEIRGLKEAVRYIGCLSKAHTHCHFGNFSCFPRQR